MAQKRIPVRNVISFRNSQGEKVLGTLIKLTRGSLVLEVYNPYSIVQLSEVLDDLTIYRGERPVYQGRAVVSNLVNTGLMLIVSAALVDPWKDLADLLSDPRAIQSEVDRFLCDYKKSYSLNAGFQLIVGKIRSFLNELSLWLEQLDIVISKEDDPTNLDEQHEIIKKIFPLLAPSIAELFRQFENEANKIEGDEVINHKIFAQHNLHPLLLRAPFMYRTFSKPLGYAGDYEMMNMLQRDPVEGPTVYTNLINTQFTNIPISRSVGNRTDMLVNYLRREAARIVSNGKNFSSISIACGPALEVQRFIANDTLSENCVFNLVDFDRHALDYAENRIKDAARDARRNIGLHVKEGSVHVLLKNAAKGDPGDHAFRYDFVYCSGLFDYLSDKVCSRLLRLFYQWVKPGGLVYVTNMHPCNPDRKMMEYIMEWFLIYRDESQMRNMAQQMGMQKISYDETGVNIGLELRKPFAG